jgi:hypothetical protein
MTNSNRYSGRRSINYEIARVLISGIVRTALDVIDTVAAVICYGNVARALTFAPHLNLLGLHKWIYASY